MPTVKYNPYYVLDAADQVFTTILDSLLIKYRRTENPAEFHFDASPDEAKRIKFEVDKELDILNTLWRETLEKYLQTKQAQIELHQIFAA